jgi:hypothetical protein
MSCFKIAALLMHVASYHTDAPSNGAYGPKYNNVNPGLAVRTECGLSAGVYYNSIRKVSVYGAYTYDFKRLPLFVSVGVATGYDTPIAPIAMVGVRVKLSDQFRLRAAYIPKISQRMNDSHIAHFALEFKL